MVTLNRTIG